MRIALLTRNFSRTAGGAESYAIAVAQEMSVRHEVHVFYQESDQPVVGVTYHLVWRPFKRPRWLNQIAYALITWWLTRKGFDVVHSHEHVIHGNVQTLHVQPVSKGIWGDRKGWRKAIAEDPHLRNGLNIHAGKVTCRPVAEALGLLYTAPDSLPA